MRIKKFFFDFIRTLAIVVCYIVIAVCIVAGSIIAGSIIAVFGYYWIIPVGIVLLTLLYTVFNETT